MPPSDQHRFYLTDSDTFVKLHWRTPSSSLSRSLLPRILSFLSGARPDPGRSWTTRPSTARLLPWPPMRTPPSPHSPGEERTDLRSERRDGAPDHPFTGRIVVTVSSSSTACPWTTSGQAVDVCQALS
ncbi:hypothetical protein J2X98_003171 [Pseudarthrobacter enclensis]|uniref:Uncharacterized protein n=1 Tax=Pseudarthrobacter enclensis TaxID=993070 RepID=A0ABT9RWE7_9MICC|nr:hypothetical protein [Pseudarthrobacter enclensis]